MTAPRRMMAMAIAIDKDELAAALDAASHLVRYMDPGSLLATNDGQEIVMAAKLLQAAMVRRAANSTSPAPDFCHSQPEAARLVAAARGLKPGTFRANKPWLLLTKRAWARALVLRLPYQRQQASPPPRAGSTPRRR
ncbi:hypothetical protein GGI1_16564 [Acidithiobacillus sp. GGI-221]|nr:hypothetical protein GGI1_16564 [Acidithiobacillus sp. GGI-221]